MTGKEALDELMETFYELCEECDCNEDMYQKHNLTSPHHIIRKELDLLAKYKKAFEILKNKLKIGVCLQDDYPDGWTLYGGGTKILSQEEYELLEELMRDENS